jgi:hypothetical protein
MPTTRKYVRRANTEVAAVRLDLDTRGFTYRKWGATQRCKRGDWIVDNGGDVYTVDAQVFRRTYRARGKGTYVKVGAVWARQADRDGVITTLEGKTRYAAGAYLVFQDRRGRGGYAVEAKTFRRLYRPA